MPVRIRITIKDIAVDAELFDTPCGMAVAGATKMLKKAKDAGRIRIEKI